MKALLYCLSALLLASGLNAQLKVPSPSPEQNIHQAFGLSAIDVSYSRPSVKGRTIFGDLVPFGIAWRTGANGPTTISFGEEVLIEETKIPAGKYGLVTIPGKDHWIIIITKQLDIVGSADYNPGKDIVRVNCRPLTLKDKVETFSMQFENIASNSCELWMKWDHTAVSMPIKIDIDGKVMAGIEQAMNSSEPPYFQAAFYYFTNGKDLHKAEEWAQKATEKNPKAYYMFYLLAQIQAKNGERSRAIATANKSIELSKESKRDDYISLNEKLIRSLK